VAAGESSWSQAAPRRCAGWYSTSWSASPTPHRLRRADQTLARNDASGLPLTARGCPSRRAKLRRTYFCGVKAPTTIGARPQAHRYRWITEPPISAALSSDSMFLLGIKDRGDDGQATPMRLYLPLNGFVELSLARRNLQRHGLTVGPFKLELLPIHVIARRNHKLQLFRTRYRQSERLCWRQKLIGTRRHQAQPKQSHATQNAAYQNTHAKTPSPESG